jgi:hypothetical protein
MILKTCYNCKFEITDEEDYPCNSCDASHNHWVIAPDLEYEVQMESLMLTDEQVQEACEQYTDETSCPHCQEYIAVINKLKPYFQSGNDIPVERATILAKDFWTIVGEK